MLGTQKKAEEGVIKSSIALLQERFKQVERVKEMREKRQLLQIYSTDIPKMSTTTSTLNHNNKPPTTSCVTLSTIHNSSPTIMTDSSTLLCANPIINKSNINEDDDDDDDNNNNKLLQVFLPPNYYSYYSSYPSSSTTSSSSSSYEDEVLSLSLWPLVSASATRLQQSGKETGPTFKLEHHSSSSYSTPHSFASDVDTTLHL